MSKKSLQKPEAVSTETRNAVDVKAVIDHGSEDNAVDKIDDTTLNLAYVYEETRSPASDDDGARSAVELHHESVVKYVQSDDETMIVESDGFETCGHSNTPSEDKELHTNNKDHDSLISEADVDKIQDVQNVSTDSEADDENDVQDVYEKDAKQGLIQLHLAAKRGDTEAVRSLLTSSTNVNVVDTRHNTSLHIATLNGQVDVVDLLQSKKVSVNSRNASGQTSLHLASKNGHLATAQLLLDCKADVNAVCRKQATPLHLAAKQGFADIVKNLVFNSANVNACNKSKMTPLHLACRNGHTTIVEILLDNNATVNVRQQSEETPFYLAAKNGHAAVSDLLMRRGICDFVESRFQYDTPLVVAIKKGHTEVVEVILKHICRIDDKSTKDGKKLQKNTKRGVMPVELLKTDGRHVSAEIVWRERNTPLEVKRYSLGKALEQAALSNDPKMVQLMLSVDQCMYSETDLADSLYAIITNILPQELTHKALSDATRYTVNFRKLTQYLINSSKFNINHQDYKLNTFLHNAIRQKCKFSSYDCPTQKSIRLCLHNQIINDVIQLLLENGADFNMKNTFGVTPLIIASGKGHCDAIQILFDFEEESGMKLDLDARDQYGETALIKAAEGLHVSIVRLLLSHKASVNLCNYCGFTALHAAVFDPNRNWLDLHFFCKGLHEREFNEEEYPQIEIDHEKETIDPNRVIDMLQKSLEYNKKATRKKEEIVQLLLAIDESNVNVIDFRGNTPLDLAMKSSKRISSATFKALEEHGAIQNFLELKDEAPIEVARVDERGRNPLHRFIACFMFDANEQKKAVTVEQYNERLDLMFHGILLRPENFRESATATDDKGRTSLHYLAIQPSISDDAYRELVRVLLEIGSNVNAADMYGKTPLHYAEVNYEYELLVQYGANENIKDKKGHTPKELKQLRELVAINEDNVKKFPIGKEMFHTSRDIAQVFNTNHVTELSKRKLFETIRIYSQSPPPQESVEEAIWKIWTKYELIRLNRRLPQLKPSIQHFIQRLADGIKEKDWRFECQPILVGSADEETKVVMSGDFDFTCKLIKFSQLCDPMPHPLGPKGYFQLKRKPNEDTKCRSDERFDSFFSSNQILLTNEVNSRFKIILEEVLLDHNLNNDEHLFECDSNDNTSEKLCTNLRLRMIDPTEYGEDDFLLDSISIDIVACVEVKDWWPDDPLPVGISPAVKTDGCTFVFDRPHFDLSKPHVARFLFSETFARISFAPLESRIIKESSPLIKAAFMFCKMMLHDKQKAAYQMKNCILFCIEALNDRNGSETRNEDEITPKQLAFWVERLMFCFMEFSRHDVYPCYFMPSFKQIVVKMTNNKISPKSQEEGEYLSVRYSAVYDIYLSLCPDDTVIHIPIVNDNDESTEGSLIANNDPNWEQFNRDDFISKIYSRSSAK